MDKKYVVNEAEANLVRHMFDLLLELQSCRKVADALNAEGSVTKRYTTKAGKTRGGDVWTQKSAWGILTDRKYSGRLVHKGKAYPGEHPAIVSVEIFEKAQATMAANKAYAHKHQVRRFSLLRRMLRCGHCGSIIQPSWVRKNHGELRYYTCAKKIRTGYGQCPLPSLPAGTIETAVVDQLRALLRHPDVIARTYRQVCQAGDTGPDAATLAKLEDLRKRREQTQKSIRAVLNVGDQSDGFMAEQLNRLSGELRALERAIHEIEAEPARADGTQPRGRRPEGHRPGVGRAVPRGAAADYPTADREHHGGDERHRHPLPHQRDRADRRGTHPGPPGQAERGGYMPSVIVNEGDEMMDTAGIESGQQGRYPGLSIHREGQAVVVHIPMRFRRRNGRQMIVMAGQQPPDLVDGEKPPGPKRQAQPEGNQMLIKAIAKAHHWQEQLESGKYASIDDLAQALKVDRTYVSRMLRLTSLAPDIVESILQGNEPNGLSLSRLHKDLPVYWQEQREKWATSKKAVTIGGLPLARHSPTV